MGQDAGQVRSLQAALPLRRVPRAPVRKVLVALPLELVPAIVTGLRVCRKQTKHIPVSAPKPRTLDQSTKTRHIWSVHQNQERLFNVPKPGMFDQCTKTRHVWSLKTRHVGSINQNEAHLVNAPKPGTSHLH